MAETALTKVVALRSGVIEVQQSSDEANGNSLPISGNEVLRIENTDASTRVVTFVNQEASNYTSVKTANDETASLDAGEVKYVGPFKRSRWADGSGNLIMSWSAGSAAFMKLNVVELKVNNPDADTQ